MTMTGTSLLPFLAQLFQQLSSNSTERDKVENLRKDKPKTTNKNKTPGIHVHVFLKRVVFSLKMLSERKKKSVGVQL